MRSERLLVWLKSRFLGDAVMATPLLNVLAANYDNPTILAAPHIAQMLANDVQNRTLLTPMPNRGFKNVLAEAARLRRMRFRQVILVNRSFRSALTAFLAGIPERIGHSTEHRRFLLTKGVVYRGLNFEGDCYGDLARAIGLDADFTRVKLTPTAEEMAEGNRLISGATVGVQPGASFAEKTLPAKALGKVVDLLASKGHKAVMLGGKEEKSFGDALQAETNAPMLDLIGQCSIRQSMGVSASLQAMIGGSTGMMHIAAAVGCPTVTVFGPTLPSRWGHLYEPHQTVKIPTDNILDMDPDVVFQATLAAIEQGALMRQEPKAGV